MMWMGRMTYRRFQDTDTPSPAGATIVVNRSGLVSMAVQEVAHLVALVDDVVRHEQAATWHPGEDHVEEALVVALPGVEEHEVELSLDSSGSP